MEQFSVILALWFYPTISYWIIRKTKDKPNARKKYFNGLFFSFFFVVLGYSIEVSFTSRIINWTGITLPFLLLSSLLWTTRELKQRAFRILGILSMVIVFGIGFLISTIGLLGLMFILGDYKPSIVKPISKELTYSETGLGNAVSNYRGRRFEIHQKIKWMPIFKRRVASKEVFNNLMYYQDSISVNYHQEQKKIFLELKTGKEANQIWRDTLYLNTWE